MNEPGQLYRTIKTGQMYHDEQGMKVRIDNIHGDSIFFSVRMYGHDEWDYHMMSRVDFVQGLYKNEMELVE